MQKALAFQIPIEKVERGGHPKITRLGRPLAAECPRMESIYTPLTFLQKHTVTVVCWWHSMQCGFFFLSFYKTSFS